MQTDRPNIILITTDQQRFDTIEALGQGHMLTPHFNWLMDQGITFRKCYSDAPACVPARTTIMTGKHGYSHGVLTNGSNAKALSTHPTLPQLLQESGYQTCAIGKMHFAPMRATYGFERFELTDDYYRYMENHPEKGNLNGNGLGHCEYQPGFSTLSEENSITHWTIDRSIDFLETRDPTRPFFMWTSFTKPHPPFDPDYKYWSLYNEEDIPDAAYGDWSEKLEDIPLGFLDATYRYGKIHRFSPENLKKAKRAYYALITQIDYNLGLLFGRLKELKQLDNTWIIFTSDHGEMLGDHHLCGKGVFFEGSSHVPMIVRPPSTPQYQEMQSTQTDALVCLADILPTCLKQANIQHDAQAFDGKDLIASWQQTDERKQLCGLSSTIGVIIDQDYKYHFSFRGEQELLFNIQDDPMEQRNLSNSAEHSEILASYREALQTGPVKTVNKILGEQQYPFATDAKDENSVSNEIFPGFHTKLKTNDV